MKKREDTIVDVTIQDESLTRAGNSAEAEEKFRDMAVGLFVHWSLDSWQSTVISHWVVGADEKTVDRFYQETPKYFDPLDFRAEKIARLAKQCGAKYGVFTTKHHNGFCMFDTASTHLNVMNTPYSKDVTREICDAFRKYDIAPGLYFSPLDFYWCKENGKKDIHFLTDDVIPKYNPGLMAYNKQQVSELLAHYGNIFCMFFDGPPEELRELVWEKQPDCLVTRGAMKTPEQNMPTDEIEGAWEACYTLGDGWSYKPTNETYKTGTDIIEMLIEIRARGGNLLINVTPDSDGVVPFEQERILRELGTFLFFNGEAIYDVRPWDITHEDDIWFTKAKDSDTVYAFVTGQPWPHGFNGRTEILIKSIQTTENTVIEMVGQTGRALEHCPGKDTETKWHQDEQGLHISAMRCYRPYDNRKWPNPVAFRITNAAYKSQRK